MQDEDFIMEEWPEQWGQESINAFYQLILKIPRNRNMRIHRVITFELNNSSIVTISSIPPLV